MFYDLLTYNEQPQVKQPQVKQAQVKQAQVKEAEQDEPAKQAEQDEPALAEQGEQAKKQAEQDEPPKRSARLTIFLFGFLFLSIVLLAISSVMLGMYHDTSENAKLGEGRIGRNTYLMSCVFVSFASLQVLTILLLLKKYFNEGPAEIYGLYSANVDNKYKGSLLLVFYMCTWVFLLVISITALVLSQRYQLGTQSKGHVKLLNSGIAGVVCAIVGAIIAFLIVRQTLGKPKTSQI